MAKSLEDGRLAAGVVLEIARFSPKISKNRGKTQGRSEGNQMVEGKPEIEARIIKKSKETPRLERGF